MLTSGFVVGALKKAAEGESHCLFSLLFLLFFKYLLLYTAVDIPLSLILTTVVRVMFRLLNNQLGQSERFTIIRDMIQQKSYGQ